MNTGYCATGRAFGVPFFCLLLVLSFGVSGQAAAQTVNPDGSRALDPGVPPVLDVLSRELERAETLFKEGDAALADGREIRAREAFDEALDVFVDLKGSANADPRFQAAYSSLIDRIKVAEIAAGPGRQTLPMSAPFPQTQADSPLKDPPGTGTLAELGDRIENANPSEGARESNEAVLGSELLDLPIELNDQVLGAIDLYSGRFNKWFSQALSRGLPHLPRIREILSEAGIPQDLAYVPIVESAFNPSALSRAKAKGLWQFIPSTGRQYGLKQDFYVDERSNMEKATLAAAQYLKRLYAIFGDWNLALAGYNAGEGRVQRAITKARTTDFWALARTKSFRAETKNYVPLIHAAIVIAKSPESYGIDVSTEAFTVPETIQVARSYPISTVARCASAEPSKIRHLNPELRRGMTPSSAFDLKVPAGSGERVTACLAGVRAMDFTRHIVERGDTLSKIANMFGVSAFEIARANDMTLNSMLRLGVALAIPRPLRALTAKTGAGLNKTDDSSYKIRKGDTLSSVAASHGTTVAAIKALNGLNSTRLSIGQVLRVALTTSESLP
ncbi:MAG: transglycosylase SLT domain-containing protein [Vicinamibacteria bacterium]|nr:transglycosylase SLT domain-containing protein [Vicinamibacteria bacterium]